MENKKLLFWGELPPKTIHGISLSSQRILNVLSNKFDVLIVEDNSSFGNNWHKIYSYICSFFKVVLLSFKKIDYFYVNAPMSMLGLVKVLIVIFIVSLLARNVKIISHLHRGDFNLFIQKPKNRFLFKCFSNLIDYIIVLSNTAAKELEKSNLIDTHKIIVLHNTIEVITLKREIYSNISSCSVDNNYYCLCNYIESKGIHNLVSIANQMLVRVDFNGTISDTNYMAMLNEENTHNVCVFGKVISGLGKEKKIFNSKALILPSLNEGMPLVLLESLAQGTPVICYDVGFISDYLGHDYPGLMTLYTNEALIDKIKWMESLSSDEYLSLRYQSYDLFWNKFSSDKINELVLQIFSKL